MKPDIQKQKHFATLQTAIVKHAFSGLNLCCSYLNKY